MLIFSLGNKQSKIDMVIVAKRKMIVMSEKVCVLNRKIENIAKSPNPIPSPISIFANNAHSMKVHTETMQKIGFIVFAFFLFAKNTKIINDAISNEKRISISL